MDIVLGMTMAPTVVRMVLIEGENADGAAVEQDVFRVAAAGGSVASEQVIGAILGTREGAAEAGHRLMSTGVTWTDPAAVAALRDALAVREIRNVMLVSPLLAAAALAQTVGQALGYEHTALLFVDPESAILAVVQTADGSIAELHRQLLSADDDQALAEVVAMVAGLDDAKSRTEGVFLVGCGVDIVPVKQQLDATVSLPVSAAEEPDMALARGAALASANAPLFASSTAALAYAQDPGTGEVKPPALAYSAVTDQEDRHGRQRQRPFALLGSAVAALFAIGAAALTISLVADIEPTTGQPSGSHHSAVVSPKRAPAPPAVAAPSPPSPPSQPPQTIPAPTPVVQQSPHRPVVPTPAGKLPVRQAPVYVPPAPVAAPPPAAPPPPLPAAPPPPPPAAPPAPQLPPMVL
ncbi:MAG: DUF7159 family protein, partial [Mycobacterium sp.]